MNILWVKDGKLGHEKQVKALLEELAKEIPINVIEYQPDGILTKKFKYLFSPFSASITNQDIRDINQSCNENNISIIIGAGRKSHWHILKISNVISSSKYTEGVTEKINITSKPKKIAVMFPAFHRDKFDIVCAPKHDINKVRSYHKHPPQNILFYEGSLAKVSSEEVDEKVGMIAIGGKNKHYLFNIKKLMDQIEFVTSIYPNKNWYIFPSRRTPSKMRDLLTNLAKVNNKIILSDKNFNEVLNKASIKIITQDSVNMVYESLSTRGSTVLFNMKYFRKNKVINQMNELLSNKQVGYIEYNKMVKGLNKIKIHMQNPHHEVFAEVEKLVYKIKIKLNLL